MVEMTRQLEKLKANSVQARRSNCYSTPVTAQHGGRIIEITGAQKIVYSDDFQKALLDFVAWYKTALSSDPVIQESFIRKFDSLYE
jgi:hypothetical protein